MKNALHYFQEILTLVGDDRRKLHFMLLFFLGVALLDMIGLGLIAPYIALVVDPSSMGTGSIGELLKLLKSDSTNEFLLLLSGSLAIIFFVKAFLALGINNLIIGFAQNQQVRLTTRLMRSYQLLPYSMYLQRNSAEYIHFLQVLTGQFQGILTQLMRSLIDIIIALAILGLLISENVEALSLLLILVGVVLLSYDFVFRKRMMEYGARQNEATQILIRGVHEGLEGLKEIRILGREDYFHRMVQLSAQSVCFNNRRFSIIQLAPRYLLEAVLVLFVVILVVLASWYETSKESLLVTLGLFGVAGIRLIPMASMFATTLTSLRFGRDAISRLYADVKNLGEPLNVIDKVLLTKESFTSLVLKNVQFSYPNTNLSAIKDLNLEIQDGESIGLIGSSGSGKTTLVDVLLGLLEPQSGKKEYNGQPLQENLGEWRSQVAPAPAGFSN